MGAWSHEPFGNDTAADWAYGLNESNDLGYIEATIDAALGDEFLDSDIATEAIAAVEILARALERGSPGDSYSKGADAWIVRVKPLVSEALREKAIRALDATIAEESELRGLWEDSDHYQDWLASVASLRLAMQG